MRQSLKWILGVAMATTVAGTAQAQNLNAPDGLGVVILDLATNTDNTIYADTYTQYTTQFVANGTRSTLTFAFRTDPGYFTIDNISVVQHLGTLNLIQNGGFETAPTTGNPVPNWSYGIQAGINGQDTGSGLYSVSNGANGPKTGLDAYVSGAFGGYDYISQSFNTTTNAIYDVTFFLNWADSLHTGFTNYSQTSTNNLSGQLGNGIDVVVYDQVPEPASLALFGVGAAAIGWVRRRRA